MVEQRIVSCSELERVKSIELELLNELSDICDRLDIKYYLAYGTLIGAVRHKGFIPWDDDIDVMMPRGDYEKFLKEGRKLVSDKCFIQCHNTDKEYWGESAKLRRNGTVYREISSSECNIHHGIYIDIFPYDNYRKNRILDLAHRILNKRLQENIITSNYYSMKQKCYRVLLRLLLPSRNIAYDLRERINMSCGDSPYSISRANVYGKKEVFRTEWLDETVNLEFEGRYFLAPKEYDKYLKHLYGDYMKLPPKEKRSAHHPICELKL